MPFKLFILLSLISFTTCFLILPGWIRRAETRRFVGRDLHKKDQREVAEMGGIVVIFSAVLAILVYIAFDTFYYSNSNSITEVLAVVASILIATIIGMTDDMLGWRIGLRQREKVLLTFLIPLPLAVINAGESEMTFPFLGTLSIGLLYPLLIVPVGMIGASNAFNMLAGYNGLEAGMGIITLSTLGLIAYSTENTVATVIAVTTISALVALLYYNKYPAKVFPGDTLTYPIGAIVAIVAIIGNMEKSAAMLFFLYYIEFLLKARGKLNPKWTSKLLDDGSLAVRDKVYSIPHITILLLRKIKGKAYEYEVVSVVLFFQAVIALYTLYSFYHP
ncbi:MraY family glycosyltransferase [Candidatus Methanoperedens nitratireducens]|uniref:Glycosyl transferase, family 4 n=1 Tax=Candidatus Methanoperedens nitratireducens TaxID=1392998 RepID=A0A284VNQ9_9EURY|nr:glycosyltransferase 4 family protein [Candidatus Methanoperedens nitroreducens]SNQ60926.1 Glycosyl transferase, family 4 [Candidatus Methanoperedens nitroreducens]